MTAAITIILYYLLIGAGVLVLLIVTESVAASHHGPDFRRYMTKAMGDSKPSGKAPFKAFLLFTVFWPLLLWHMVKAFRRGKSFFQVVVERKEKLAERREKLEATLAELDKLRQGKWTSYRNTLQIRSVFVNKDLVLTHMVIPYPGGGFLPCRLNPLRKTDECLVPIGLSMVEEAAKRVCEEDQEWLDMAADESRHPELERWWREGVALFHPIGIAR